MKPERIIINTLKELTKEIKSLKEKVEDLSTGAVVVVRTPPPKYIPEKEKPVVTDDWEKDFGRSQKEEETKISINNPPGDSGTIHAPEPYFVKESEVFEDWENDLSHNPDTVGFSNADWNYAELNGDSDKTTTDTVILSEEDLKKMQDCDDLGIELSRLKGNPERWREMLQKMSKEKKCGPKKEFELEVSRKEDKLVETTVALPQYEVTNLSDQKKKTNKKT